MPLADAPPTGPPVWLPRGAPRSWFVLILVAAAGLRVIGLDKPLYIDEIVTIRVAMEPLATMGNVMHLIDASPALYPVLLRGWIQISQADAWVRLLSVIFGVLAVPAVGAIAARAFGWRTGLAAMAIMAIAPAHIHYAQYVRSYSLFTFLAAWHVWLLLTWFEAAHSPPERRRGSGRIPWRWLGLVALTAALCYTHYLSLLLFAGEGLAALVLGTGRWRRMVSWAGALAVAGLLFLPGLPLLAENMTWDRLRNAERAERPPAVTLVPNLVAELSIGQQILGFDEPAVRRLTLGAAAVMFPALWLAGLAAALRTRPRDAIALTIVAWLPLAIYLIAGRRLVAVRFFVPFMAGYTALLAHGWVTRRRNVRIIAGVALAVVCAVPLWRYYTEFTWSYDHRRVARVLASRLGPDDALLFVHPYEAFFYRWYLGDRVPMEGLVFTALVDQPGYAIKPPLLEFDRARARVEQAANRYPRVWVIGQSRRSFASDPVEQARLFAWMDTRFSPISSLNDETGGDPEIRLYAMRDR
jgi:4-amino-4-deoxy-L-arabinose transferase-like glycosyltransferase